MRHSDEPKMDELKRLLRRLDGLDGSKSLAKKAEQAEAQQRGYVGALRGAPVARDGGPAAAPAAKEDTKSSKSAVYVAALTAALISTVTVYLLMTWQSGPPGRASGPHPASQPVVPSGLDMKLPARQPSEADGRRSARTADDLVREAERLMETGDVAEARALLQQAAEQGSGVAALKLGHSYDPAQAPGHAGDGTNATLARAWYERALALGTQEAASYIPRPPAR